MSCHAGPCNGPSGTSHDRHGRYALARVASTVVAGLAAFLGMLANAVAGFSLLTLFTFVATFIQAGYVVVLYLFGGAGAVCWRWRGSP